eukprot:720660-Prorocentrum_minimum.AAC.1
MQVLLQLELGRASDSSITRIYPRFVCLIGWAARCAHCEGKAQAATSGQREGGRGPRSALGAMWEVRRGSGGGQEGVRREALGAM